MKKLIKTLLVFAIALSITSCSDDDNNQPQTIAAIASANPNLSTLVQALQRANLVDTFNASGDFTVFAPTNDAFQSYLGAGVSVNDVPVATLTEILKNHVLAESFTSSELTTGYYKTLAKGTASATNTLSMYIDLTSGVRINGPATNGGANVVLTSANIAASNGVIHVVDRVIALPTVVNHAIANPNFTSLVAALTRSGNTTNFAGILGGTVNSPFTVFAPTNDAFTAALAELSFSNLAAIPEPALDKILKYHVIAGANIIAASLPSTPVDQPTFLGQTFKIGTSGGAKITDFNLRVTNITATDVQASNGVIHVVDKVLLPSFN